VARTAIRRRLSWQLADVVAVRRETSRASRLSLRPAEWSGHQPGQHVDVRLTAADGYTAQRSYSVASPPEHDDLELIVERLEDGEVSPYLTEELRRGDQLELRGPIGGYFIWPDGDDPVQLIAGGSGVVPFLSMLGHHRAAQGERRARLLYSARTADDLLGMPELAESVAAVTVTLTRGSPANWDGLTGRVDETMLSAQTLPPSARPHVLVCGPTGFVETIARALTTQGHDPSSIKTERFGATGGQP
jgi:ferredoxin-NADP reductase